MWKIFQNRDLEILESFQSVNDWKDLVFSRMDIKLKQYFANKVVVYFDNKMLFQQKNGLHENLMESLSLAEKDMQQISGLFPDIRAFWIPDNNNSFLITLNLPHDESLYPNSKYGFELIKDDAVPGDGKLEKLQHDSWGNLVFSTELSDFSRGWINYTPSLEERTALQVKYIIMATNFKNKEYSLMEKIQFEENIEEYPQFEELYNKILRVMPKIESTLEEEWRTSIVSGINPVIKIGKKGLNK
jgi:hypothetical protein